MLRFDGSCSLKVNFYDLPSAEEFVIWCTLLSKVSILYTSDAKTFLAQGMAGTH